MTRTFRLLVAGTCALAGTATIARAQGAAAAAAARPIAFGISAGANLLQGDIGDGYGTGYLLAGHALLKPAALPVGLRFDLGYSRNGGKASEDLDGTNFSVLSGFANAVFAPAVASTTIRPYLLGGLGYGRLSFSSGDDDGFNVSISENKFGFQVGAGVELPLTGFTGFAEVGYQRFGGIDAGEGEEIGVAMIPIRFGIRF